MKRSYIVALISFFAIFSGLLTLIMLAIFRWLIIFSRLHAFINRPESPDELSFMSVSLILIVFDNSISGISISGMLLSAFTVASIYVVCLSFWADKPSRWQIGFTSGLLCVLCLGLMFALHHLFVLTMLPNLLNQFINDMDMAQRLTRGQRWGAHQPLPMDEIGLLLGGFFSAMIWGAIIGGLKNPMAFSSPEMKDTAT